MWLIRGRSYQPSRIPRLITLTETLTKPDITKTETNNCFIEHCFKENTVLIVACTDPSLTLLLEIMHCAGNVQISRLSVCHNKQLLDVVEHDIMNYQNLVSVLSAEAEG